MGLWWPGSLSDLPQEGVGRQQRCGLVARQGETTLVTATSEVPEVLSFLCGGCELRCERLPGGQGAPLRRRQGLGHENSPSLPAVLPGVRATASETAP